MGTSARFRLGVMVVGLFALSGNILGIAALVRSPARGDLVLENGSYELRIGAFPGPAPESEEQVSWLAGGFGISIRQKLLPGEPAVERLAIGVDLTGTATVALRPYRGSDGGVWLAWAPGARRETDTGGLLLLDKDGRQRAGLILQPAESRGSGVAPSLFLDSEPSRSVRLVADPDRDPVLELRSGDETRALTVR